MLHRLCNIKLLLFQPLASHATLLEADTRTPYKEGRDKFNSANNAGCSCSHEFPDSEIGNKAFQTDLSVTRKVPNAQQYMLKYCQDNMDDTECYYYFRQHDRFDLSIENVAKDGCTVCYGVGPHLWQIPEDELLKTLTRSNGEKQGSTDRSLDSICRKISTLSDVVNILETEKPDRV